MKALLYKDLLVLWVQNKMYLAILLVMGAIGVLSKSSFTLTYCTLITSTLVLNMLQTDENCHWLTYTATTPIPRRQVVGEKYLLNFLILLATLASQLFFRIIAGFVHHDMAGILREFFYTCSISFIAMTMMALLSFPVVFRFGVTKGRLAYLCFVGSIAAAISVGNISTSVGSILNLQDKELAAGLVGTVLCLGLYAVSYKISVKWYESRELA